MTICSGSLYCGYVTDAAQWLRGLNRFIPSQGIVFDIGANRGVTTQCFARRAVKVFAFEPVPENTEALKMMIRARNIENVHVIQAAVSDSVGQADLHLAVSHDH